MSQKKPGTVIRGGKDGVQIVRSEGARWTEEAEVHFLDQLAASCNVTLSAKAVGFSREAIYKRRRHDPAFAERWQAALEQGYARIEMLLVQRATDALEGRLPDPDTALADMSTRDAIAILQLHRASASSLARIESRISSSERGRPRQPGARPTPRPGPVLKGIMDAPDTVVTGGPTRANPHLAPGWKARVERLYAGTRLGRQELDGELLPDAAGALWTAELIERCRIQGPPPEGEGDHPQDGGGVSPPASERHALTGDTPPSALRAATSPYRGGSVRTVIAVDPPSGDGTCGIIACARESSGDTAIAHVLADHSVTGVTPEVWAAAVAAAARAHGTCQVVAEQNQGGKMVKAVLHTADPGLRVKLVTASAGKATRAEPVSHLFEAGRAFLHGRMPELEAQLLGLIAGGGYEGPGPSPDRADAMVWGVTELMLGRRGEPKIWRV